MGQVRGGGLTERLKGLETKTNEEELKEPSMFSPAKMIKEKANSSCKFLKKES